MTTNVKKYNQASPNAVAGKYWENNVFRALKKHGLKCQLTFNWLKSLYPDVKDDGEIWGMTRQWGDIIIENRNGDPIFIECATQLSDNRSKFPERKRQAFIGKSKWYAMGWNGTPLYFIPSNVWYKYAGELPSNISGEYRVFPRHLIQGLRARSEGIQNFMRRTKVK